MSDPQDRMRPAYGLALGALALGAFALGALAIGYLAIGRLAVNARGSDGWKRTSW